MNIILQYFLNKINSLDKENRGGSKALLLQSHPGGVAMIPFPASKLPMSESEGEHATISCEVART